MSHQLSGHSFTESNGHTKLTITGFISGSVGGGHLGKVGETVRAMRWAYHVSVR